MSSRKVMIIEDEFDIREFLTYNLSKEGYEVIAYANPLEALSDAKTDPPDIVLTDWLMPEMDGLDVCKAIKMNETTSHIPVIMITCKSEESDVVTALEIGADDYLIKPFRVRELLVRIKKNIRRNETALNPLQQGGTESVIIINGLVIDKENFSASLDGEKLNLTFAEFKLLEILASRPGKVFTRYQIIENASGEDYYVTDRSVDVKIAGLRKKLGNKEYLIETIRSVGYKFNKGGN